MRHNCRRKIFVNEKKLKNTEISIAESITATRRKLLNNTKEQFGFRNIWTLDGKFTIWLRVAQNLKSLEVEQKWLV